MTPYQKHKKKWSKCKKCDLAKQRKKVCLFRGPMVGLARLPTDVLFLGEAPGVSEDVLGKPFVGPAGHLLESIVKRGLPSRFFRCFTNLVACFPKEAKKEGTNEPSVKQIEACEPRLKEFLALCKPKLVVYVGKLAAKYAPTVVEDASKGSIPEVVEIAHPAALLRMDASQQSLAVRRCIVAITTAAEDCFE